MNAYTETDANISRIKNTFNIIDPNFAYICGGLRRIGVDGSEWRARKMLLSGGFRYFTKMQAAIYAAHIMLKPDLFLDVGVNYAECLFSKPLFDKTKTIGFEANPDLIPHINRSALYNDDVNVELVPKAVGDVAGGELRFYVNELSSGKSTAARPKSLRDVREIIVPCTTIDAEVSSRNLDSSTLLMKIDVEGYEPYALRGAVNTISKSKSAAIFLEFDSLYIERSGVNSNMFFDEILSQFKVFEVNSNASRDITSFSELTKSRDEGQRVHVDLCLLRFSNLSDEEHFRSAFLGLRKFVAPLWDL